MSEPVSGDKQPGQSPPGTQNLLGAETSPYLRQHKDNPVAWRPWGSSALAEAAALNRPILLSVGYAACHWCHVMAHESFEDPAIAALMNELFIPIKVDREERPDLDMIYQQALAMMGQQGGWPLTMFLTPKGEPFFGGTYFPPASKWGRTGFPDVLRSVDHVWQHQRDKVDANTAALLHGLKQMAQSQSGGAVSIATLNQIAGRLAGFLDPVHGGTKGAPKFPNPSMLEMIWRGYSRTGDAAMRQAVLTTLDHMSEGGIYDHLGGGYARYSTDEAWLAPHFEKMLYDNAQLIPLLLHAWQDTGKPLYRQRIEETVGWVLREMRAPDGGFSATIDADSEHVEGKFYVWDESEIDQVLGADSAFFKQFYDVSTPGNWEEKTILNRNHLRDTPDETTEQRLTALRQKLFDRREGRVRPGLDDKVLADWNGLMIGALAEASWVLGEPEWLQAAVDAFDFVSTRMAASPGRLLHSWRQGQSHAGTLDDHANMADAALALLEATGELRYLDQARAWVAMLDRHFRDADGSYFLAADDAADLIERPKTAHDAAVPSGNGTMVKVLAKLWALTGEEIYREEAERLVSAFSGEIDRNFFPIAALLNGADLLSAPMQIAVIGPPESPTTQSMIKIVSQRNLPNRLLIVAVEGADLAPSHPAFGKRSLGEAAAYICRGPICSTPITTSMALEQALAS